MTFHLELDARAEKRLAELAESEGTDVESTLKGLVQTILFKTVPLPENPYTIEERLAALDRFSRILPPHKDEKLNERTWSRAEIYDDDRF